MNQSINEYIEDLNYWRKAQTPLNSQYITWSQDANGMTPNVNREAIIDGINATNGIPYNGLFKVIEATTDNNLKVSVIDGYSEEEPIAGYVYIDDFYPVDSEYNIAINGSGYILLTIYTANEDVVCVLSFDSAFDFPQDSEPDIQVIPIAYINVDSSGENPFITEIQQLQLGIPYLDLLKFPSLITDYDDTKKMALIIDAGNYKFIEIGDCNS